METHRHTETETETGTDRQSETYGQTDFANL